MDNQEINKQQTVTILAGDIGATKTILALVHVGIDASKAEFIKEQKFITADYTGPEKMIEGFLSGEEIPAKMCFGVAGPVNNGEVKFTNVGWDIKATKISAHFNNTPVCLLNDLETTAYGIEVLKDENFIEITEHIDKNNGNIGVIAPGTGLGEAGMYWDGQVLHPFATEGGHSDFAPREDIDFELLKYLQEKYGHVSWERVISGNGIYNIFEFLRDIKKLEVPCWLTEKLHKGNPAAIVSQHANQCEICTRTMDMFFRFLATEAANLALKFKATGGIFIAGGIVHKNIELLNKTEFVKNFCNAGRMKPLLQAIRVSVTLDNRTALLGAVKFAVAKMS